MLMLMLVLVLVFVVILPFGRLAGTQDQVDLLHLRKALHQDVLVVRLPRPADGGPDVVDGEVDGVVGALDQLGEEPAGVVVAHEGRPRQVEGVQVGAEVGPGLVGPGAEGPPVYPQGLEAGLAAGVEDGGRGRRRRTAVVVAVVYDLDDPLVAGVPPYLEPQLGGQQREDVERV